MGRLQLLGISTLILYTSVTATVLSTSKKDLERAAELAVERAAEKAAERAVEKALNSGNSSTITVTVKESYSNAKKTAEEAAAPGSESTRPYNPNVYDREYSHNPNAPNGYKVNANSEEEEEQEAEEEEQQQEQQDQEEYASDKDRSSDRSLESKRSSFESSIESSEFESRATSMPIASSSKAFEHSEPKPDFTANFDSLDISSDASFQGNFGLKSDSNRSGKTRTFSRSYSPSKYDFPETKVDVDDHEDAKIFKMYASRLRKDGWSSAKEKGWVRHRPLWDDSKSRIDRPFWDDFHDMSTSETMFTNDKVYRDKERMYQSDQLLPPPTALDVNSNHPLPLFRLLHRPPVEMPSHQTIGYRTQSMDGKEGPVRLYITIPVTYPPNRVSQKDQDTKMAESRKHRKNQPSDKRSKQVLQRSFGDERGGGSFIFDDKRYYPIDKRQARLKNPSSRSVAKATPENTQFYNAELIHGSS